MMPDSEVSPPSLAIVAALELTPAARTPAGPHFQLYALSHRSLVRWRLLSANNRDLGRGGAGYQTAEECLQAIATLLGRLPECEAAIRPGPQNRWLWSLRLAGTVLAVSSHGFDRQIRCMRAQAQFVSYAPAAVVDAPIKYTGSRRTRGSFSHLQTPRSAVFQPEP